jgi:hypothetical protein
MPFEVKSFQVFLRLAALMWQAAWLLHHTFAAENTQRGNHLLL